MAVGRIVCKTSWLTFCGRQSGECRGNLTQVILSRSASDFRLLTLTAAAGCARGKSAACNPNTIVCSKVRIKCITTNFAFVRILWFFLEFCKCFSVACYQEYLYHNTIKCTADNNCAMRRMRDINSILELTLHKSPDIKVSPSCSAIAFSFCLSLTGHDYLHMTLLLRHINLRNSLRFVFMLLEITLAKLSRYLLMFFLL